MSLQATIAHYKIIAKLGEGGMGEVWRATDTKLGRDVAIKVLPAAWAQDAERMARFAREAQVLASMNHPNIAAIYGVEDRALVMELVEGHTLAGPMSLELALPIIHQLIDALEYAHEKGIVHRDLKPANIKVTPEGRVKVLDFGLAKAISGDAPGASALDAPTVTMRGTVPGMILGTMGYLSPEQARGQAVDRRADIWAFGVVVWELLTGKHLFAAATASDTLAAVLTREPDLTAVPLQVRRLLGLLLTRDPRYRLRDISDARFLLEESPATKTIAPLPWILATALMGLLAAVALWSPWRKPAPQELPLMRLSVDLGSDAVAGARTTVAISPDGTRIVYPVRVSGSQQLLATRLLEQPKSSILPGTEGGEDAFFSADGKWIAFWADGKLKKMLVQGGPAVTVGDAALMRGGSWGVDGSIVLAPVGVSNGLSLLPADGRSWKPITKLAAGEVTHRWPQFLPGGAILFTAHTSGIGFDDATIKGVNPETGHQKILVKNGYFARYVPSGHLLYIHENVLFAVPFDPIRLESRGTALPVVDGVGGSALSGGGQYASASNGTLVYLPGQIQKALWTIVTLEASGKTKPVVAEPGAYLFIAISPDAKQVAYVDDKNNLWMYDISRQSATHLSSAASSTICGKRRQWNGDESPADRALSNSGLPSARQATL